MTNPTGKGGFVKGQSGNPRGRAPRRTEVEYLDALIEVTPIATWKRIAKKAAQQAERGDARARQWLSDYVMGPPVQRLEHGGADGGAIEHIIRVIRDDNRTLGETADRDADAGTGN